MKLLGQGSTKDLYLDPAHPDLIALSFSDRVSVFDYGALADDLPGKGEALRSCAVTFFEWLEAAGVPHAADLARSRSSSYLYLKQAAGAKFSPRDSSLKFLPVEVIFRWGVPDGSSLLKRGSYSLFQRFEEPLVEFTTKLEEKDRLLSEAEAKSLLGERLAPLRALALSVAKVLRERLDALGFELWDGKIECAWDEKSQQVVVVDSIGPDELRLTLKGLRRTPLSKELLRQWLARTNWAFDLRRAKETLPEGWKEKAGRPPRLGVWRRQKIATMYQGLAKSFATNTAAPIWEWVREETPKPKVYVHGGGGREAALRWRLEKEGCEILSELSPEADLCWVSMDADLDRGLVNEWEQKGLWVYGPRREAALLEASKIFGREVAREAGIPQPEFRTDPAALTQFKSLPVLKKDGLAAGKGVVLPDTLEEAEATLKKFQEDGAVLLEERCEGPEASAFFAVNSGYYGVDCRYLGCAQDFKRRFEGDEGPNTGGMGAYAPHAQFRYEDQQLIQTWAHKAVEVLAARGIAYNGILYVGLMKDKKKGWILVEFNARFGDPETQALALWWNEGPVLRSILNLSVLDMPSVGNEAEEKSICLALVRREYPQAAPKDFVLPHWEFPQDQDLALFQAQSVSGRVAYVVGRGPNLQEAGDRIFGALVESPWRDLLDWRKDILP